MKKLINIVLLFLFSFVIYWQGGPGEDIRYMQNYGQYTTKVEEARLFDSVGDAYNFQKAQSSYYGDSYNGFHMGVWNIKEY